MRRAGLLGLGLTLLALPLLRAGADPLDFGHPKDPRVIDKKLPPEVAEFKTVSALTATRVSLAAPLVASQPGYLGLNLELGDKGRLLVAAVEAKSPADQGGVKVGDQLLQLNGHTVTDPEQFGSTVRGLSVGESVYLLVSRGGKEQSIRCMLGATSRLMATEGLNRISLGFKTTDAAAAVKVDSVQPDSPAASAGVKQGDLLVQIDDKKIKKSLDVNEAVSGKLAGQSVSLILKRDGKEMGLSVKLTSVTVGERPMSYNAWDVRSNRLFKKPVFRLALVQISFPDVKPNTGIAGSDWERALFSRGTYLGKNATGQQVYGSLNDYYLEQSLGKLRVEGKAFDWVQLAKKRDEYGNSPNRFALMNEALEKIQARDGANALDGFDGIFFIHAGGRVATNRGNVFWPHRSTMFHKGKRWDYFICPEGGRNMDSISVITHEFGHMLGLPDLYARPETPGSEGLGIWCTMATGHGRDGKPMHFSAWCKEQLGWLEPVTIDPTVKQKIVLAPIEFSPKECVKIIVRPDGGEYLLLEVRSQCNSGRDLPQAGLLIWRVVDGKPVLEESHGIAGPDGPGRFLAQVPYPSGVNNAFTPYTTPSSRSLKGGGLAVHISNITRLPDGRVTFMIGYEFF